MRNFETVAKFGGTSMAQPEAVAEVVEDRPEIGFIVVSAPGTLPGFDRKMTDVLIDYGKSYIHSGENLGRLTEIIRGFEDLYKDFELGQERKHFHSMIRRYLAPSYSQLRGNGLDYFAAQGEWFSARYFAGMIGGRVLNTAIRFDANGQVDRTETAAGILRQREMLMSESTAVVIPGFYGFYPDGVIGTLGRGGSDRTQAIYGAELGWHCENWTDKDGIHSTDPEIYLSEGEPDRTVVIGTLGRDELREGAHGGSGVLQGNTVIDLNGSDVVVTVKNTFNPSAPGTRVVPQLSQEELEERGERSVVAVSGRSDLVQVGLRDLGMAEREGYVNELLAFLAEQNLPFEHMPAAQDSVAFTMHANQDDERVLAFEEFARSHRLSQQGRVALEAAGVVYVVGERLRDRNRFDREEVIARCLSLAVSEGIHVTPVVGSNMRNVASPSIAFLTEREKVTELVKAIHSAEIESAE